MLEFSIGLGIFVAGTFVGFLIAALLVASHDRDNIG